MSLSLTASVLQDGPAKPITVMTALQNQNTHSYTEKKKIVERGSRVNLSCYFAFFLPPSTWCDSSFIVFYYITKISQCKPYIREGNGITRELGNGPKELTMPRGEASSFIPLSCPHTGHVRDAVCWGLASSVGAHRIHFPSRVRGGAVVELDHFSDWGS